MVFLDKTCIHQEDKVLLRKGIEKLGAFLAVSKTMIVLYTDIYTLKLWTVYEVASFLVLHPLEAMKVVTIQQAFLYYIMLCGCYMDNLLHLILDTTMPFNLSVLIYIPIIPLYMLLLRMWSRERLQLESRMTNFDVERCDCFCDEDRPKVYKNIVTLMKASGAVPYEAGQRHALDAFNDLVRNEMANVVMRSHAKAFHHSQYVALSVAWHGSFAIDRMCKQTNNPRGALALVAGSLFWILCALPLAMEAASRLGSSYLHLAGWRQCLWLSAASLFGLILPCSVVHQVLLNLEIQIDLGRDWAFAALLLLTVLGGTAAGLVINWANNSLACIRGATTETQSLRTPSKKPALDAFDNCV